ncbi:hypothetical protein BRC85_04475 [Halobacteriales archaeon QS_1_69_70]|nr:MAG: hypothetical protein BRC85_04475 [Halobacteriales archaeon QS_1_69_70]
MVEVLALLVAAFAGGALGAAVGALEAFSLAGILIVVGETTDLAGGAAPDPGVGPTALGSTGLTASVGLGPLFGPHVAFAGGAAATAFAARQGHLDTDFGYHEAKHVTRAHGPRVDVMAVGGAFGVLGVLVTYASAGVGLPWDPIAFSIVVTGLLARVALGYPLVGTVRGDGLLDMSPYADRARGPPRADGGVPARSGIDPADTMGGERRFAVEPWLPHQYRWGEVSALGAVVGVLGAFVTYRSASPLLAFGIAAATLLFLCVGVERFPVTHHVALVSSLAVVGLAGGAATPAAVAGEVGLLAALLVGAVFGVVTALAGELAQRVLYAHADTHVDPPAAAIVVGSFLVALLDVLGVFQQSALPTLGL